MSVKTITIDMEAYELLSREKRDGQSFSQVIKAHFGPQPTAARFLARDATPGSERALGWDTPSREKTTLGTRLGRGPRGAVGHLGFTGCSLWVDLDREVVCALLTNHVHPDGADKQRINAFRARFHDAVAQGLGI